MSEVSFLKFSSAPQTDATSGAGQDEAAQKKAQVKADVIKKLEATPVTYGMEQTAAPTNSSVSIPIGQSSSESVDRFSAAGLANTIEGYDEVSDDADVKNTLASSKWNPANWFKGAEKTESSNNDAKVTDAGLPTLTNADLKEMDKTDAEIAKYLQSSEFTKGATQGATAGNSNISTEQRSSNMNEMLNFAKQSNELMNILSDPKASEADKAEANKKLEDIQAKAAKLFESTPTASSDKPELNAETQAKVDNLSPQEQASTQQYLQGAVGKGVDSDDKGFKDLSNASQGAITAMAGDLKAKHPDMD